MDHDPHKKPRSKKGGKLSGRDGSEKAFVENFLNYDC